MFIYVLIFFFGGQSIVDDEYIDFDTLKTFGRPSNYRRLKM